MNTVKSLADSFHPYPAAQQIGSNPKEPLRDKGTAGRKEAIARATDAHGKIRCEDCGRPIPKDQVEAHHLQKRSQMGGNEASNCQILGRPCHRYREAHGGKIMPKDLRDTLKGQCKD